MHVAIIIRRGRGGPRNGLLGGRRAAGLPHRYV